MFGTIFKCGIYTLIGVLCIVNLHSWQLSPSVEVMKDFMSSSRPSLTDVRMLVDSMTVFLNSLHTVLVDLISLIEHMSELLKLLKP